MSQKLLNEYDVSHNAVIKSSGGKQPVRDAIAAATNNVHGKDDEAEDGGDDDTAPTSRTATSAIDSTVSLAMTCSGWLLSTASQAWRMRDEREREADI